MTRFLNDIFSLTQVFFIENRKQVFDSFLNMIKRLFGIGNRKTKMSINCVCVCVCETLNFEKNNLEVI